MFALGGGGGGGGLCEMSTQDRSEGEAPPLPNDFDALGLAYIKAYILCTKSQAIVLQIIKCFRK